MDLISVIVPVYNVEKYLDRCVESIVNQTYTNLEIILVDDGSPDNCPLMCDLWAEKDSRIKVIHQSNMGAGAARNAALEIANGVYISFVDSDDILSKDFLSIMYKFMNDGIDIVECEYSTFTQTPHFLVNNGDLFDEYLAVDALLYNIKDNLFKQIIWNKLYKKSVINDIRFPVGKRIDDEYWTYKVIGNAKKLVHISDVLYSYRQHDASVMHSLSVNKLLEGLYAKKERYLYCIQKYPSLINASLTSLWMGSMYVNQIFLRKLKGKELNDNHLLIHELLVNSPMTREAINSNDIKNKIWLTLARVNFLLACKIRNFLHIGV